MLPGKRDFYHCCKARRSASHVNNEFWQQFQNYAPPSLRGYKNKFCSYHNWRASEASETLSGLCSIENRGYTRKMVPIMGRASSYFVCTVRGLRYQKQNRMEEETEPQT